MRNGSRLQAQSLAIKKVLSRCYSLSAISLNSLNSISPETDRCAFLVNAMETTSRRIDDQI